MSKKRQALFDPRGRRSAQATTLTYEYPDGYVVPDHFHDADQLVFACRGVMTVHTTAATWIVPTQRAVWIPARTVHGITMTGTVSLRTLYLKPKLAPRLPRSCCVLNVAPLLRELILHACMSSQLSRKKKAEAHLLNVIVDQLSASQAIPLQLPKLADARAVRVAEALLLNPADGRALKEICKNAGASKRTIERIFQSETSMSVGRWRQQLRLMHAMRLLAAGQKTTLVALEAGYSTPSAFISMFRKVLGTTPSRYFKEAGVRKPDELKRWDIRRQ